MPPVTLPEMRPRSFETDGVEYTVRAYGDADADGFRKLYETVWVEGAGASPHADEWFDRKFVDAPYTAEVPNIVVEAAGETVATLPFIGFRIRTGSWDSLALQATNTMVHPDHRRRGLFSKMVQAALDRYGGAGDPAFVFNFPNDQSIPGYRKHGWRVAGFVPTWYRFQHLGPFLDTPDSRWKRLGTVAAETLASGYLSATDRLVRTPAGVTVTRYAGVRTDTLASLYRRDVPDRLHVRRDEAYYDWRFSDPEAGVRTTYVAHRDGLPVAAAVTRTDRDGETTITEISDVVPLGDRGTSGAIVGAVIDRIVDTSPDADLYRVSGSSIPPSVLRSRGFLPSDAYPLGAVFDRLGIPGSIRFAVRALDDDGWVVDGRSLVDTSDWLVSSGEIA